MICDGNKDCDEGEDESRCGSKIVSYFMFGILLTVEIFDYFFFNFLLFIF